MVIRWQQTVLILPVGGSANNSLVFASCDHFCENFLKKLLQIFVPASEHGYFVTS
jgi:hypothetical protein